MFEENPVAVCDALEDLEVEEDSHVDLLGKVRCPMAVTCCSHESALLDVHMPLV